MHQFSLGVIAQSRKENERRLPIHPHHLDRIDGDLRKTIYLEHGYGEPFGVPDERLTGVVAGLRTREQLIAECDIVLLAKPLREDVAQMRAGQVLWGWPHCVQDDLRRSHALTGHGRVPLARFLAKHDIVVNCVLQDTAEPLTFLIEDDLAAFAAGSLIIDVSCDKGMGFSWARPTTFTRPTFPIGDGITYYAVDHSPSYLWNSATWEISEALLPHLRSVLSGPSKWDDHETVRRAVEIRDGTIRNPAILSFQHRSPEYPHHHLGAAVTRGCADCQDGPALSS